MREPRFSLRQLAYFVHAAERGTLGGAAEDLSISPSALSDALTELETQFGAPLMLRRKGRGALVTALGADILPDARALLAAANALQSRLNGGSQEMSGRLVVGCMSTLAPFLLPRLIREFNLLHPLVTVDFMEGSQLQVQELLADGRCEMAILYDDGDLPSHFDFETLYTAAPKVLLPAGHRLEALAQVPVQELVDEPMIVIDIPPSRETTKAIFRNAGLAPKIRYSTRSFELARAFVAGGYGSCIAVQRPAGDLSYDGGRIVVRPLSGVAFQIKVLLCRLGSQPSQRIQAMYALCRRLWPGRGPGSAD